MTITVVCDVLGKENNGTTIAAMNLIRSLKAKGWNVRVLCPDKDKMGEEGFYVAPTLNLGPINPYLDKMGIALAKSNRAVTDSALEGADIVHIMMPFMLGASAMRRAKAMGIPVTAGFHCQAENFTSHLALMNNRLANNLTYKGYYRFFYRYADAVHYPTEFIRDTFEKVTRPTPAYVISNGVNKSFVKRESEKPDEFKDKFVILFTGRYSREKSHHVLIDAVAKSKYADKIQLIFAGAGPMQKKYEKRCGKRGIAQPVYRFFSREELINVINYADLYVHPAEIEIEAIACLEAISCGLVPVIANSPRCATKAFALDEKNLFEVNDSSDLASKIDYWIEHPEEKQERGRQYLGYTERFDHDRCMDEMEKMLLETIEKSKTE